jgi:hypothetical protein
VCCVFGICHVLLQAYVYIRVVSCCHRFTVRTVSVTWVLWLVRVCVYVRVQGVACSLSGCVIIVFTVLRLLRVRFTAVRLLHLLYFGLHEFIALRCAYCICCISACMSYLEATANQLEGYQRGR